MNTAIVLGFAIAIGVMLYFWRQGRGDAITAQVKRQMAEMQTPEAYAQALKDAYAPLYRDGFCGTHTDEIAGDMDSRIGGPILWPSGQTPPVGSDGVPMQMLVQINLADFHGALGLPPAGLLQFFVGTDDLMGLDFETLQSEGHVIILHGAGTDLTSSPNAKGNISPFELDDLVQNGRAIQWTQAKMPPNIWDYRIENALMDRPSRKHEDYAENTVFTPLIEQRGTFDVVLLGSPDFTQGDIRDDPRLAGFENLLGMSSTGGAFMWGDAGEAVVMVPGEDLPKFDLSRAVYSWDCH